MLKRAHGFICKSSDLTFYAEVPTLLELTSDVICSCTTRDQLQLLPLPKLLIKYLSYLNKSGHHIKEKFTEEKDFDSDEIVGSPV